MKRFRIILITLLVLVAATVAGLYLYFNDARLREMVLPMASDALGTEVQADKLSLSLFRNFPSVGVQAEGIRLGDGRDAVIQQLQSMSVAVRVFPLLSNRLDITNFTLRDASLLYVIYPDSSTNVDAMMNAMADSTAADPNAKPWEVDLKRLVLQNVSVEYRSAPDTMLARVNRLDLDAAVHLGQVIRSEFEAAVSGLSASKARKSLVNGISFGLDQKSVIDLDNEIVTLEEGDLKLGDFALALTGSVSNWNSVPALNLSVNSQSSDFGELLQLLPADLRSQFASYDTRGSFDINGTIKGEITETSWPRFDIAATISEGYLKDRNLPTAIEQVHLQFTANNDRVEVARLNAVAGSNHVTGQGLVTDPLDEKKGAFELNLKADVDLATVRDFYDVRQVGVEQLRGKMKADVDVKGQLAQMAEGKFDADIRLENGFLKYAEVPQAVEDLFLVVQATRDVITISDMRAKAGDNRLRLQGNVTQPMDTNRTAFDLDFDALLDLATVKEFYPISEDTLAMRGLLTAKGEAKGTLRQVENSDIRGNFALRDGFLAYKALGDKPIEDIQLRAEGSAKSIRFDQFGAKAGVNKLAFTGTIIDPLVSERTAFDLDADMYLDLATVKEYYPIDADTLQLSGIFTLNSTLQGKMSDLEDVRGNGAFRLQNGRILYTTLAEKALEDLQIEGALAGRQIRLDRATMRAGTNTVAASGTVAGYLSETPLLDMTVNTTFNLAEANDFVDLGTAMKSLSGQAVSNLTVRGPASDLQKMHFLGSLDLNNVRVEHDSLAKPISDLNAKLQFSEKEARLDQMSLKMGSSDITIQGAIAKYMALMDDEATTPAELTGSLKSRFLNLDEIYPMSGSSSDEVEIVLPNLNAQLSASIDSMIVFTSPVTQIQTTLETTPKQVQMKGGQFNVFDGTVKGAFVFDVLNPRQSILDFSGNLSDIRIEAFFRDFPVFGENTRLHQYVSGGIHVDTDYKTALDAFLNPETPSTQSEGTFGMTQVRIKNHPIQNTLADFLKIPELKDIGLDSWTAKYKIGQSLLTLQDMKLTSREIGFELEGVENLRSQEIAYQTKLYLPRRYTQAITNVLPAEAVNALVRPDSTVLVPILVSGTWDKPQVGLNQDLVRNMVDEYVRRQVGNVGDEALDRLKNLFRRN